MWISIQKLEKLEKEIEKLKTFQLDMLQATAILNSQIGELKLVQNIPLKLSPEQEQRLKELELWQNKLHSLMIEKTPANKDKISKNYSFLKGRL